MVFARKFWKLLVAVKDGLALLFLLLFFMLLYAALSARPGAASIREGALLLRLDGSIVEEAQVPDPFSTLLSQEVPSAEYPARDLVRALRAAAKDDRVKAVVLDLSLFTGGGLVNLRDIGMAMNQVRAAKKPVLTYAVAYSDDATMLAAHASEVWVHPMGGTFLLGPGGNNLYFAGLLDRLKVNAHVFRVGTYKSAVEPILLEGMSPAAREQGEALYGALWETWLSDVKRARPKADVARATGDPVGLLRASGGDMAKAALAAGLVDRIGDEVEFGARVAEIAGKDLLDDRPGSFAHNGLRTYLAGNTPAKAGKAIGVVTIAGDIVDGDAGPGNAGGNRIVALLDEAADDDLAALVVRVDSPGGSILASERIRAAIQRHKAKGVPIVVSMANVAASGGYWVSTPAERIFAEPGTITGSIGVFAVMPTFEKALASWGVNADGVKTTPLSGQPDVVGGLSPEVQGLLQASVEGSYQRFLGLVGASRSKSPAEIDRLAQGRVWDGGTARQLGLVDQFGGIDAALAYAAGKARLGPGEWHARYLSSDPEPWAGLLSQMQDSGGEDQSAPAGGSDFAALMSARRVAILDQAAARLGLLVSSQGVQAYCMECPVKPRPADTNARAGLVRLVRGALGL